MQHSTFSSSCTPAENGTHRNPGQNSSAQQSLQAQRFHCYYQEYGRRRKTCKQRSVCDYPVQTVLSRFTLKAVFTIPVPTYCGGGGGGGGSGFFLACEDLGRMFDHSAPACAFFFFLVDISSRTLIPLLCQDQSTVAQRAETTVAECSLTSCV